MITDITVAGQPVDLGKVIAENVTVMHGRSATADGPTPSGADLTLLIPENQGMPAWTSGDPISILADHAPLFTGTISDLRLPGHVDTAELGTCAQLELMCAGPLAKAGYRVVGDEPWPQETGSARATRILTLAGLPHLVQTPDTAEVQVLPRDVDAQPALTLLEQLADDTGAAVVDLPDGRVLYQPLESRSRPTFIVRWMDLDPTPWTAIAAATTWADLDYVSEAAVAPLPLPPGAVLAAPEWFATAAAVINHTRVSYGVPPEGSDQAYAEALDDASIARYGRRYAYLGTRIATLADAAERAAHIITTQARERWAMGGVTVWEQQLDADTAAAVQQIRCGRWVQVDAIPQPAPATSWAAIVEGWQYTETHNNLRADSWWTMALSDPLHSLAVMTWADFTPTQTWSQFPPNAMWVDVTSTELLEVAA